MPGSSFLHRIHTARVRWIAGLAVLTIGACASPAASTDAATDERGTGGSATGGNGTGGLATGGSRGTGGVAGSGGIAGTGGVAGSGGIAGSGGVAGSGGLTGTGGAGSGGRPGTSGATGGTPASTGGATSTGGRGGAAGSPGSASGGRGGVGAAGSGGATGGGPAGGTGGALAAGGRGGSPFSPCPAAGSDCAIMPLGDSITDGYGTPGGYRIELFRKTLTAGQHVTFVGRNQNGPTSVMVGTTTTPFPQHHEGYSGYTIDPAGGRQGISPLTDAALTAGKPHIVLLQIGTNDIDLNLDVGSAPTRLGALLDRITTDAPNALLVVAKITPLNYDAGNARVEAYNAAIPALVQSRVAAGKHLLLVDMYAPFVADPGFKTSLLADQWHPNPAGYAIMAGVWYGAIKDALR